MKQTYIKMMALAALPLCIGGALATNAIGGKSNAERLVSMEKVKGARTPERVITIDGRKIKIIDEEKLKKISKIG